MSESNSSDNKNSKRAGKGSGRQMSSSNSGKQAGIRNAASGQTVKPSGKVSPIAELSILPLRGGNLARWRDQMAVYCIREYGQHGLDLIRKSKKTPYLRPELSLAAITDGMSSLQIEATRLENESLRELFKYELTAFFKNDKKLQDDLIAMYSVIWGQLSDESQVKIRHVTKDFDNAVELCADAKKLWEAVLSVHQSSITGCSLLDQENARNQYQRLIQSQTETIANFKQRFDAAVAGLIAVGEKSPDEDKQAMRFLSALDPHRFAGFRTHLENNDTTGSGEMPATVLEILKMAENFKITVSNGGHGAPVYVTQAAYAVKPVSNPHAKSGNNGNAAAQTPKSDKKKDKKKSGDGNSQNKPSCDFCKGDHYVRNCAKMQEQAKLYQASSVKSVNVASNAEAKAIFTVRERAFAVSPGGRECDVLLDNQATIGIFHSHKLVRNIRKADPSKVTSVLGINGNDDAEMVLDHIADTECFGEVYFHPKASANVLSLGQVEERDCTVTYEQGVSFTVVTGDSRTFVFSKTCVPGADGGALYTCTLPPWRVHALVSTVPGNEAGHTTAEVGRAKLAQQVTERLGFPSLDKMLKLIKSGSIVNLPITAADLKLAMDIYGPSVAMLKGKNKQRKSKPIRDETISMIVETKQCLHADIMFVDSEPYLVSVSKPMHLIMATYLGGSRSKPGVRKAIEEQLGVYTSRNFQVNMLFSDCEGAIVALITELNTAGVLVNLASPGQHVPVVENAIRVIKERIRCVLSTLPFKMPRILMRYLVSYVVGRINMVPSRSSADFVSPREKFLARKTDWSRDTRIGFLQSVVLPVTSDKQDNSPNPRMFDALALHPTGNLQGSVLFYKLETDSHQASFVTREHWKETPMTQQLIDKLNSMETSPSVINNFDPVISVGESGKDIPSTSDEDDPFANDFELDDEPDPAEDNSSPLDYSPGDEGAVIVGKTIVFDQGDSQDTLDPDFEYWSTPEPSRGSSIAEDQRAKKVAHLPQGATPQEVYNIMLSRAIRDHGPAAWYALFCEIAQLLHKGVWQGIDPHSLTVDQRRAVIRSSLFLKEKFNSLGEFLKLKARLVAGGDGQDRSIYEESETSSPTCSLGAVMMVAAIAAKEHRHVYSVDIGGAYLNADMKADVFMRLDPKLAALVCALDPSQRELLEPRGSLIVKLKKALYGCVESGKLWYDKLVSVLLEIGFTQNDYECCLFNITQNGVQETIAVYVDDLLLSSTSLDLLDWVCEKLGQYFDEVKVTKGHIHSFLGMTLDFSVKGKVSVTMPAYISDALDEFKVSGVAATPALPNLFEVPESPPLSPADAKNFHRWVAMLLYLPKRCRPDITVAVAFLSTRVQAPTAADMVKLDRCMKYLNGTRSLGICIQPDQGAPIAPRAFVDASYGVHADGKSHTGCVITLGKGPVYIKSGKQKIVSKSSTEAELVGLSDSLGQIIWSREFLIAQGYDLGATTVYQDNLSTIAMSENGRSNSERSRHINIRYFFVKDRISAGEVSLEHLATEDMVADILTKPLQGNLFRTLRAKLMNWEY